MFDAKRLLALFLSLWWPWLVHAQNAPRPIPVKVHTISPVANHALHLSAVGSLLADESISLRPEISGRIVGLDFQEGRPVARGQVLVRLDDAELLARIRQVEAELHALEEKLRRTEHLRAQQFVSEQAVIDARQAAEAARARRDEARALLAKTRIVAPFSGQAGLRQVSIGAYVDEGQDIVGLYKVDRLKLDFRIPEIHLGQLRQVRTLEVRADAWPERVYTGRVLAIDPQVDPATRTLRVRARVENRGGQLKPGMFARVEARVPGPASVRVPEQAILSRPGKFLVYRIVAGKAQPVTVRPGAREAGWVQVIGALKPGDVIVTEGHLKLKPDSLVQVLSDSKPARP